MALSLSMMNSWLHACMNNMRLLLPELKCPSDNEVTIPDRNSYWSIGRTKAQNACMRLSSSRAAVQFPSKRFKTPVAFEQTHLYQVK